MFWSRESECEIVWLDESLSFDCTIKKKKKKKKKNNTLLYIF